MRENSKKEKNILRKRERKKNYQRRCDRIPCKREKDIERWRRKNLNRVRMREKSEKESGRERKKQAKRIERW